MEMTPVKCIVYKVIKLSLKSDTHSCFVSQGNVSSQVNITEAGYCDSTLQYICFGLKNLGKLAF